MLATYCLLDFAKSGPSFLDPDYLGGLLVAIIVKNWHGGVTHPSVGSCC